MPLTRAVTDSEAQVSFDQMTAVAGGIRLAFEPGGSCRFCALRRNIRCLGSGTEPSRKCIGAFRNDCRDGAWKEVT